MTFDRSPLLEGLVRIFPLFILRPVLFNSQATPILTVVPLSRFSFLLACLVCVLSATARAQQGRPASPLATPPSLPAIPGAVPINAPAPAAGPDAIRMTPFVNAPIGDVLKYYETLSGKHVIYDNAVQGSITLDITTQVTSAEALHLIEAQLNLDGYALIPAEGNLIKVISIGKNPRQFGVPIFYDLADVPDTDQIVSFLVHLHYLEPQETTGLLAQYIQINSNIAFTPLVKAGAILITDTGRSVRRLVTLINQIDLPASPVTERFFNLQRADATKAVEFLNSVFETKASGTTAASNPAAAIPGIPSPRRPIRRVGEDGVPVEGGAAAIVGPNGALSLNGDSLIYGRISLTADVRTNRVYVVTSPVNMPVVESVLTGIRRRHALRHARARGRCNSSAPRTCCPSSCRRSPNPALIANGNGTHARRDQPQPQRRQQQQRQQQQRQLAQQFERRQLRRFGQRERQQQRRPVGAGHPARGHHPDRANRRQHQDHR